MDRKDQLALLWLLAITARHLEPVPRRRRPRTLQHDQISSSLSSAIPVHDARALTQLRFFGVAALSVPRCWLRACGTHTVNSDLTSSRSFFHDPKHLYRMRLMSPTLPLPSPRAVEGLRSGRAEVEARVEPLFDLEGRAALAQARPPVVVPVMCKGRIAERDGLGIRVRVRASGGGGGKWRHRHHLCGRRRCS